MNTLYAHANVESLWQRRACSPRKSATDILGPKDLTEDKKQMEVETLYRLMCFNVFAHNRDDHSKNFTYLYEETEDQWRLSPAYDLTYSSSIGGEHATTVYGNGKNPGMKEILAVADQIGMDGRKSEQIAEEVRNCVKEHLSEFISKNTKVL